MTDLPSLSLFLVDAFSAERFKGNPAGVCLLPEQAPGRWMQHVAMEMAQAETAFLDVRGPEIHLRWFTPTTEVDLCGHATLASAHILWTLADQGRLPETWREAVSGTCLSFHTRSGILHATRAQDRICIDLPASDIQPTDRRDAVAAALHIAPDRVIRTAETAFDLLAELATSADLRGIHLYPDDVAALGGRGLIVTSRGDRRDHDILCRFFAPQSGVNEDSVTGSAHCALAPYWVPRFGRHQLFSYQASPRGGHVLMELRDDRVLLSGHAVQTLEGRLVAGWELD